MAGCLHVRRHIEHAPARPHHRLVDDVPRQPEAWTDVVVVGRHLASVVIVHEHHRALELRRIEERVGRNDARERRGRVRIEVAEAVEALGARHVELITETEIHGEVAGELPVVLHVATDIRARRRGIGVVAQVHAAGNAEEHRGQRRPLRAARHVRVALRPLRVAERELARREEELREVQEELAVVAANLGCVRAPHFRRVHVEAVGRRGDLQVGERVLTERLEILHVDARKLEGIGDVDDARRQPQAREVEAGRQREAIHEPAVEAVAHVQHPGRPERIVVIDRQAVRLRVSRAVTP